MARRRVKGYRSEAAFSASLCRQLTRRGILYQRLESGTTGRGIPDIVMWTSSGDTWLELKNMPRASVNDDEYIVPWRPGQQAWAYDYAKAMKKLGRDGHVLTVAALSDGFLIIPMTRRFVEDKVDAFYTKRAGELGIAIALLDGYNSPYSNDKIGEN